MAEQEEQPVEEPTKEQPQEEQEEEDAANKEVEEAGTTEEETPATKEAEAEAEKEKEKEKEEEKPEDKKEEEEEEDKGPPPDWELFYWPGLGGRATVIRLSFALCSIRWAEPLRTSDKEASDKIVAEVKGADTKTFPNFAYPIIRRKVDGDDKEDIVLSQTPVIVSYILNENGYGLSNKLEEFEALQIVLTIWDAWSEWAGKLNKAIGFDKWISNRIGSYLAVLEAQLKRNNEGKGWFFGDKPSVADVFLYDFMRRYKNDKQQHYDANPYKLLKELVQRFEDLEQIKTYINSKKYKDTTDTKKKFIGY